jgi:hypothetical protein
MLVEKVNRDLGLGSGGAYFVALRSCLCRNHEVDVSVVSLIWFDLSWSSKGAPSDPRWGRLRSPSASTRTALKLPPTAMPVCHLIRPPPPLLGGSIPVRLRPRMWLGQSDSARATYIFGGIIA